MSKVETQVISSLCSYQGWHKLWTTRRLSTMLQLKWTNKQKTVCLKASLNTLPYHQPTIEQYNSFLFATVTNDENCMTLCVCDTQIISDCYQELCVWLFLISSFFQICHPRQPIWERLVWQTGKARQRLIPGEEEERRNTGSLLHWDQASSLPRGKDWILDEMSWDSFYAPVLPYKF